MLPGQFMHLDLRLSFKVNRLLYYQLYRSSVWEIRSKMPSKVQLKSQMTLDVLFTSAHLLGTNFRYILRLGSARVGLSFYFGPNCMICLQTSLELGLNEMRSREDFLVLCLTNAGLDHNLAPRVPPSWFASRLFGIEMEMISGQRPS